MKFSPPIKATVIGSFPHTEAEAALRLIMEYVPQIPAWPQLPFYPEEQMLRQYLEGMPGLFTKEGNKIFFDTSHPRFEAELFGFYQNYLNALESPRIPFDHPLGISPRYSRGFYSFYRKLEQGSYRPLALKGQITGPITLATALTDQNGKSVYYDLQLREVVVKALTIKAKWQIHQLRVFGVPIIIFIDEPSLSAYGSSAFLGVTEGEVKNDLTEIIEQIHLEQGIAGIHCCENTDWSILLKTNLDILSFDAYSFFDRLILYASELKDFIARGGVLAWGIIPTGNEDDIKRETIDSLVRRWREYLNTLEERLGVAPNDIARQSLITPSCGMGSLTPELAKRVLELLRGVSELLQREYFNG